MVSRARCFMLCLLILLLSNSHNDPIMSEIDKVYRAVIDANQALEEYKYHLVGGAAGTVSPSKLYWHLS